MPSKIKSPELSRFVEGSVILSDDTVIGIVKVSSQDIEYSSDTAKEANRRTIRKLLDKTDYPVRIYSRQRTIDLSNYTGVTGSAVTTDHYILVKESTSSVKRSQYRVKNRCENIRDLCTAGDLHAEHLTGTQLKSAVKQLDTGETVITGKRFRTDRGQKQVCRLLYVDEYPERLPFKWIAEVLNAENHGLVDTIQIAEPVVDHQRDWMDRMLARINSEISSSRRTSRQTQLRRQKHDLEDLIDVEVGGETLVNYGVYIVVRGDTSGEAKRTLDSVRSVLNRFRVDAFEPRNLNQAVKRVSPFHSSRFDQSRIVPAHSAATGFSFATQDAFETNGVLFGNYRNGTPVVLDRFSWEAGHITVLGKIGSGKTFWTKLLVLRSYKDLDGLEIYVVDPKKRDYGELIEALGGETVVIDDGLRQVNNDVVRYTVDDPSKDNTEALAETVRHVYRQAAQTDRKTLVVIDETHRVITKGDNIYHDGLQAVSTLIRESRDRSVAATLISQNADEFTRSNEGRNILRNVDCNLFFKQQDMDTQVKDFFKLSENQKTELAELRTGTELGFSEALIQGPVNNRLQIEATEREHQLIENGETGDETSSTTQSFTGEESNESGEKQQKADGGQINKSQNSSSETKNRYGLSKIIGLVSGARIKLFEYLLLTGFPVAAVLYRNGTLTPMFQLNESVLDPGLITVLGAWTGAVILLETLWVLVLSMDTWFAQYWS